MKTVIEMAHETLERMKADEHCREQYWSATDDELQAFAALVAAAAVRETSAEYRMGWNDGQINEREACAKVCESQPMRQDVDVRDQCAAAIRARRTHEDRN